MDKSKLLFVIAAFAALAVYPLVAGKFGVDLVTKIMVYAVFALSLELLVGSTGLVCFGQAAFFGIGAYTSSFLLLTFQVSPWIGLLAGGGISAILAAASLRSSS